MRTEAGRGVRQRADRTHLIICRAKSTDGRWGGDHARIRGAVRRRVPDRAAALGLCAAARGGIDGPGAWDGDAAVAVCEAGVQGGPHRSEGARPDCLVWAQPDPEPEPVPDIHAPDLVRETGREVVLDPDTYFAGHTVYQLPDIVARLGYEWMELSPRWTSCRSSNIRGSMTRASGRRSPPTRARRSACCRCCAGRGPDEDQRQAAGPGLEVVGFDHRRPREAATIDQRPPRRPEHAEAQFYEIDG